MSAEEKALEAFSKEIGKEVGGFFRTLLGPATEETGQLIGDYIRYFRFKSTLSIFQKAKENLERKGIEPKAVPLKILVPLLDGASLERDDDLQEKWAGLLASATAGNEVHPRYPKILAELTSVEAQVLDITYRYNQARLYDEEHGILSGTVHDKITWGIADRPGLLVP